MDAQTLKIFNLTETEFEKAVEHYKATGQILNRAVAMEMGLVEY